MKAEEYYLCSQMVTNHFPDIETSVPFWSGYDMDDTYHIIKTNRHDELVDYYKKVIEPYNEAAHLTISFWFRPCCASQVQPQTRVTLKSIKEIGLFKEIERCYGLTTEKNIAFCIFDIAEKFNCDPLAFINKISKK